MQTASTLSSTGGVRNCPRQSLRWSAISAIALVAGLLFTTLCFGQILATGQLNIERRAHTATLLQDGKVLIVGGDNQNGMVNQAELFDPAALTSSIIPSTPSPRADHTATLLPDGRVLIAGGVDQNGALASSEIFDPISATFSAGPSMATPRGGHTATVLGDGKILIAGGDTTGSAELYDPLTQNFSLVNGGMNTARKFHSAIVANTGQVLIVGGVNAQNAVLNTAEVYDPASQSFYLPPTDLKTPRALATLKLLSDGKVQVIGGDSDFTMEVFDPELGWFNALALLPPTIDSLGATLSTQSRAALISPTISQDQFLQGVLTPDHLALLDRADHSITELPAQNQALIAGGLNSAGQVLNSAKLVSSSSASITTDKTDYAPGSIVTITGRGFQPNEQVAISLHETPEGYPDPAFVATADAQGNFVSLQFSPQEIDVGRTFTLTAIGQSSGFTAQTAFTDNKNLVITFAGAGGGTISFSNLNPSGSVASCTATCTRSVDNNQQGTMTVTPNAGSVFAGWSGSFVSGGTTTCSSTTSPCTFSMSNAAQALTATFNANTTLTVTAASGTYGGSTGSITATLTRTSGGAAVSGQTISFTLNGGSVGSATTNGSGVATLSSASLTSPTKINAGTYSTGVGASFAGGSGFVASSGTNSLTVNKKAITVTAATNSKTYDGTTSAAAVPTITSGGPLVSGDTANFTETYSNKNAGTSNKTLIPSGTVNDGNSGNNYSYTFVNFTTGTITARALTVSATGVNKVYDATTAATVTLSDNRVASDVLTTSYTSASFTPDGNVANGKTVNVSGISISGTDAGNYTFNTTATTTANITQASSTTVVTFEAGPYVYRGTAFTATANVTGIGGLNQSVAVVYSGDCTNVTSANGCTATATFGGDTNHIGSNDSKSITITRASSTTVVTFEAGPYTYRGTAFTATANVTGVGGLNAPVAVVYSGDCLNVTSANGCTATANFAGDTNHTGSNDSKSITITRASSTAVVTFEAGPYTYRGTAFTATANVTGVGGLNQAVAVVYTGDCLNVTIANGCTATANFAGDTNHTGSNDSKSITITQASSTTVVTFEAGPYTYRGTAFTATANVTGVGGLNQAVAVVYTGDCLNVTSANGCTATATFGGDTNHTGSGDAKSITITQASSTTVVTFEAGPYTYRGTAFTATANVTGVGGLNQAVAVVYTGDCLNVTVANGCTATANFGGDTNHTGSGGSKSITITQASSTTVVTFELGPYTYLGTAFTATANVTGVGGLNQAVAVVYSGDCTNVTSANGCTATATFASDTNHTGSGDNKSITITKATPYFSNLSNPTITFGNTPTSLGGTIKSGALIPTGNVSITLNGGAPQAAPINAATGAFSYSFATGMLAVVGSPYTIIYSYAGDGNFNGTGPTSKSLTINPQPSTLAIAAPAATQYSDPVSLSASVTPLTIGGSTQTGSVEFFINGGSVGTSPINSSGVASLANITNFRVPGNYIVSGTFTSTNPNFTGAYEGSPTLPIMKEDARVTYSGTTFTWTASTSSSTANVLLTATIQDITAANPMASPPSPDNYAGDIRNATVRFVNRDNADATLCTATLTLVTPGDTKTAIASCTWPASIGSADSDSFMVGIIVDSYYYRNSGDDNTVVTVSKPYNTNFITGGGHLVMTNSGGIYAGTIGMKNNLGFNVKYANGGKNLKGRVNIIVRSNGKVYQIKSTAIDSMGVSDSSSPVKPYCTNATSSAHCYAQFTSKANLTDVTNPLSPISLGGNLTLQLTMTDKGEPGSGDSIGITVTGPAGLYYSSSWSGTPPKTQEQILNGGNLVVH